SRGRRLESPARGGRSLVWREAEAEQSEHRLVRIAASRIIDLPDVQPDLRPVARVRDEKRRGILRCDDRASLDLFLRRSKCQPVHLLSVLMVATGWWWRRRGFSGRRGRRRGSKPPE